MIAKTSLEALVGAVLTVSAALACGTILFSQAGLKLRRGERRLLAFLIGSAVLSLIVLLLAALHLARKGVFIGLCACLLALAYRRRDAGGTKLAGARLPRRLLLLALAVAAPFLVIYLFNAWAPEVSPDGSSYHLGIVLRFWFHHGLVPLRDLFGAMPEALEMLFLFAFSIGRHPAAALVHLSFLVVLALLIAAWSQRFHFPRAGLLAAVLVFASPVIGLDASVAYNDVALAAAAFGVFFLLEVWLAEGDSRALLVAGILAGFCFGIKYTGFVAGLYGLLIIWMQAIRNRCWRWRPSLSFATPAAILAAPWLVKNAIYMGNPVAPFFNRFFPNPYISPKFEIDYRQAMAHFAGTSNLWGLARMYTVTGFHVQGFLGPIWLLAPLALIVLRFPQGRRLLLAATVFAMPVVANGGTRFLIPAVPCLALALGIAVSDVRGVVPALLLLDGLASLPPVARLYSDPGTWRISGVPFEAAIDPNAAAIYLHRNLGPAWDMARMIERETPPESKILCLHCPAKAYCLREIRPWYATTEGAVMFDALWTPLEEFRQPRKQILISFPTISTTRLRIVLLQIKPHQVWEVTELRLFNQGRELPRSPLWSIRADPDPWEAPLAFDNSPVSKWSSEQYGRTGAFLEVSFDRPVSVDSVLLECPPDAPEKLGVRADIAPRRTRFLATTIRVTNVRPPAGMRRAAVKLAREYGFDYLVLSKTDPNADDFERYFYDWGIRAVAKAGDWTLYHLE